MPKGSPSAQTIASEKFQKKAGYMVKGFKVKRDIVEEFEEACRIAEVSQAAWLTQKMKEFVEEVKASE